MKQTLAMAAVLASASYLPAASEQEPLWGTVKGWAIHVDRTIGMSCFVAKADSRGSILRFGTNRSTGLVYMMLGNPIWRSIEPGDSYDLELRFGEDAFWDAPANGIAFGDGGKFLWVEFDMDSIEHLIEDLMTQSELTVFYKGNSIATISLAGSHAAVTELAECQKAMDAAADELDPFRTTPSDNSDPFIGSSG